RHLRPNSTISFISDNYHNNMTLIASPQRLAMLEQQQRQQEPAVTPTMTKMISVIAYLGNKRSN
ncbi:unnamed protein product, partial [Rotaria sp. Silwood1]